MDAERLAKLEQRAIDLADIALDETDPQKWPGMDSKEGRGDRSWWKKNAMQTLMLLDQITRVVRQTMPEPLDPRPHAEDEIDELMRKAEEKAKARLNREPTTPH